MNANPIASVAFDQTGYVRVPEAFDPADAAAMVDQIWAVFDRKFGIRADDPSTWQRAFRKAPLEEVGHSPVFWSVFSDRLVDEIDTLLGPASWMLPDRLGDFLITFPNATEWSLPHDGWHSDDGPMGGLITFVFLSDVGESGGGTLVVDGSHRLPRAHESPPAPDGATRKWKHQLAMEQECEWLRALRTPGDPVARRRMFMDEGAEIDGVELRVVELTGRAGDAVLMHPLLLHAIAPNAAAVPRFMRTPRIPRATQ
jgi:phytanoyl-CoA dioxygenase PhyH